MNEKFDVKIKSINNFIGIFETNFPVDEFINYFEECSSANKTYTQSSEDNQNHFRKDFTIELCNLGPSKFYKDYYDELTYSCFMHYLNNHTFFCKENVDLSLMENIKIQKTLPGGGYHNWHHEWTSDAYLRSFVTMLYLNDVNHGGETEFLYQNLRISPLKGTFLIWPAYFTHLHRGNPPLSGEKYIATSWIHSKEL